MCHGIFCWTVLYVLYRTTKTSPYFGALCTGVLHFSCTLSAVWMLIMTESQSSLGSNLFCWWWNEKWWDKCVWWKWVEEGQIWFPSPSPPLSQKSWSSVKTNSHLLFKSVSDSMFHHYDAVKFLHRSINQTLVKHRLNVCIYSTDSCKYNSLEWNINTLLAGLACVCEPQFTDCPI